jgi:hypothetical protein
MRGLRGLPDSPIHPANLASTPVYNTNPRQRPIKPPLTDPPVKPADLSHLVRPLKTLTRLNTHPVGTALGCIRQFISLTTRLKGTRP